VSRVVLAEALDGSFPTVTSLVVVLFIGDPGNVIGFRRVDVARRHTGSISGASQRPTPGD